MMHNLWNFFKLCNTKETAIKPHKGGKKFQTSDSFLVLSGRVKLLQQQNLQTKLLFQLLPSYLFSQIICSEDALPSHLWVCRQQNENGGGAKI